MDSVLVSVVLGEEHQPKPTAHKLRRKRGGEQDGPAAAYLSFEVKMGSDLG
jgi:hypothetical protein